MVRQRPWSSTGLILLVSGLPGFLASGTAQEPTPPLTCNAATNYWQAFGLMEKCTERERVMRESLPGSLASALPARAHDFTACGTAALSALALANQIKTCDWQIDYSRALTGLDELLPHVEHSRRLAFLCTLRARYRFSRRDNCGGIADCLATIGLARAVAIDGFLIPMLAAGGIEQYATEVLAAFMPHFNASERTQLRTGWRSLRPPATTVMAVRMEKKVFDACMEHITAAELFRGNDALRSANGAYQSACDELIRIAVMDFRERRKRFAEWEQRLRVEAERDFVGHEIDHGIPRLLDWLPAVMRLADEEEKWITRRKLLDVATTGIDRGPEGIAAAAKEMGLTLTHTPTADGFMLSSPLTQEDAFAQLRFGGGYRAVE